MRAHGLRTFASKATSSYTTQHEAESGPPQNESLSLSHVRKALFSSGNFWLLTTVAFSFVFGKNCLIMDYLGLKDSSHDFLANCVISFFFVYI